MKTKAPQKEELFTCLHCGQKGFTARGLTAHVKTARCQKAKTKAPKEQKKRLCQCCGVDISHRRPQARTCGTPCRVWLVRHG
jgi:hypothetical protein